MKKSRKVVLWSCFVLGFYLAAEAMVPPSSQPSARLGVALLRAYQATGSKAMESAGVRCRYYPSCSHYAVDALNHYGTLSGAARTAGRLFRCSPWGGSGFDPAVEPRSLAYLDPQSQETMEERQRRQEEEAKKAVAAACVTGTVGCIIASIVSLVGLAVHVFMMVYAYKDGKARGDQNAALWLVVIFFFPVVGFIVYMFVRPKGEMVPCPNCHQKKLDSLTKCPHCGTETASAPPKPPQA